MCCGNIHHDYNKTNCVHEATLPENPSLLLVFVRLVRAARTRRRVFANLTKMRVLNAIRCPAVLANSVKRLRPRRRGKVTCSGRNTGTIITLFYIEAAFSPRKNTNLLGGACLYRCITTSTERSAARFQAGTFISRFREILGGVEFSFVVFVCIVSPRRYLPHRIFVISLDCAALVPGSGAKDFGVILATIIFARLEI